MRAIVYTQTGGPEVLTLVERPVPEPGPGEVRVRLSLAGVNPTDYKTRRGAAPGEPLPFPEVVPGQDGAGTVDAVGPGVSELAVGTRVWVWEAGWGRATGTAAEHVVLPSAHVVPLPNGASLELGASVGIPALTAHRCLTVHESAPQRLGPTALTDRTVLVAGGAGAVGNAAIQLAVWSGARVIATVSNREKADLALRAGAHHVVNYRLDDAAESIARIAPEGVDVVVEVAPAVNAALNTAVLGPDGVVAVYANNGGDDLALPIRAHMGRNIRYQFVLVYTVTGEAKDNAIAAVTAAMAAGALRVGPEAGLPLHHFPLEDTAAAHAAVEEAVVGKVLLDIGPD